MRNLMCDAPWSVAERLHARLQKFMPGTIAAEATERAIDLLVNSERAADGSPTLESSLLRNGRYTYLRSRRRTVSCLKKYIAFHTPEEFTNVVTPEKHLCVSEQSDACDEIITQIRYRAANLGTRQARTFDGMLIGETAMDTATACSCSTRAITTYRTQIRAIATEVFRDHVATAVGKTR